MPQTGARPLPLKNTTFCLPIEVRNASGALVTSWTGAAATYSLDGANYASVTATPTEIQTSGTGYLNLTAGEMNGDLVLIKVTVTNTGALPMTYAPPIFNDTSIRVNLVGVLSTALTEGAGGRLAAAIIKFFDKAFPTGTINSLPDVVPGNNGGLPTADASNQVKANVTAMASGVIAAATFAANALDAVWSTTARALTDKVGFALSAAGVQAIWDALTSALTTASSIGKLLVDNINATISSRSTYAGADTPGTATLLTRIPGTVQPQTGDSFVRLGVPAGASVSADIAEIEVETDAIQTSTAPLTFTTPNRVDASVPAASDPLSVPVPGAYAAGTAGYDIGLLPSIQASAAQIGNGTLFSPVPVGDGGVTTIVLGSSYLLADGLQLDYTLSGYPDLHIGAVATWYSYTALGPYSLPGIVTAINGVRFELTAAQSARLRGQVYSIAAPLVGGDVIKTPDAPLVLLNSIPNKA